MKQQGYTAQNNISDCDKHMSSNSKFINNYNVSNNSTFTNSMQQQGENT
jgi:hypothetical protein